MQLRFPEGCAGRYDSPGRDLASSEAVSRDTTCCVSGNSCTVALRCRMAGD